MDLNDEDMRRIVKEKLEAHRIESTLSSVKQRWWRPLMPAGLSALLGIGLLAIALKQPGEHSSALTGGVMFLAMAYVCFWSYRQNCISRALVGKMERLEQELEDLIGNLKAGQTERAAPEEGTAQDET